METATLVQTNLDLEKLKKILRGQEHIKKIIFPEVAEIGSNFEENFVRLREMFERRKEEEIFGIKLALFESLYNYIRSPIIVDDFGNDDVARNAWESEMMGDSEEKNKLLKMNKLKGGNIGVIFLSLQYLMAEENNLLPVSLKQKSEGLYRIYKGEEGESDKSFIAYNSMDLNLKIKFVKNFSSFAKEVYKILATQMVDLSVR